MRSLARCLVAAVIFSPLLSMAQLGDLPGIPFKGKIIQLSADAKSILSSLADKLKANPSRNIVLIGYAEDKGSQRLSQERSFAISKYLLKEGILEKRIAFNLGLEGGDPNTIGIRDQDVADTKPVLHPIYRGDLEKKNPVVPHPVSTKAPQTKTKTKKHT